MNFRVRNFAIFVLLLIMVVAGLSGCACVPTRPGTTPGAEGEGGIIPGGGGPSAAEEKPAGITGKMTEEMCVELMARHMYATYLLTSGKNPAAGMKIAEETDKLYIKYGVSDEDFEEICNAMLTPDFMDRMGERMIELGYPVE